MQLFQANVIGNDLIPDEKPVSSTPQLIGTEGLVVLYGDREGVTVATAAPDEAEVERRIIATFGDVTIDDLQPMAFNLRAAFGQPALLEQAHREGIAFANLGHAVSRCTDPDCEIHHPEVIEDHIAAMNAMAWYEAGRRAGAGVDAGPFAGQTRFIVGHLQVVDRRDLRRNLPEGIRLIYEGGKDDMGFDRVEISAPSREQLLDFVRANWGDDDDQWFAEWVEGRIEEVPVCEDCGGENNLGKTLCESCETQRNYDRVSR